MSTFSSYLLRSLIPSWRFYSGVITSSRLRLKLFSETGETEWLPAWPPPARRWWNIFLNPHANLVHAQNSLLHQVEVEISSLDEGEISSFESSVSFRLLKNLAERSACAIGAGLEYQFRLERFDPLARQAELLLESKRYPIGGTPEGFACRDGD